MKEEQEEQEQDFKDVEARGAIARAKNQITYLGLQKNNFE